MITAAPGPTFFRHEYGRLVAVLARRVGVAHLAAVEDAAQAALLAALETWTTGGLPDDPPAWLYRVAHNHLVGGLRQRARHDRLAARRAPEAVTTTSGPSATLAGDVDDDLLRMLFVCCDAALPVDAQLVIALKTLCGFDVREIAERLFVTAASVYKRLGRARRRLRAGPGLLDDLTPAQLASRLPAVHTILHLLFTEGYLSSHATTAIRRELCDEATRLTQLLASHPVGQRPETFALLALMHLHLARLTGRRDDAGGLLLLEEQDRDAWDQREIECGMAWLARSAHGEAFSRYHAEAGIAAEHCMAPSFATTRWDRVVACYQLLERVAPSPLHTLNRAVAVAEWRGPAEGLAVLEGLEPPSWLAGSYMWAAVLADLHGRCDHPELARSYRRAALATAPSTALRELLQRRLGAADGDGSSVTVSGPATPASR